MNKSEALAVMHEICDSVRESLTLTCVSLDPKQVTPLAAGYQIRMKGELDTTSRRLIETILGKHKLTMREEQGYIVVF